MPWDGVNWYSVIPSYVSGGLFYLGFESESLALKMSVAVPLMSLKRLDFELASGWQWMWDVDVTLYHQRCEWLSIMV